MGGNYSDAGFRSVEDFIYAQNTAEGQIRSFINFVKSKPQALKALRKHDFVTFARIYNGKNYKDNEYDTKLANAYKQ